MANTDYIYIVEKGLKPTRPKPPLKRTPIPPDATIELVSNKGARTDVMPPKREKSEAGVDRPPLSGPR